MKRRQIRSSTLAQKMFTALVIFGISAVAFGQRSTPGQFSTAGVKVKTKVFNERVLQLMDKHKIPGISLAIIEDDQIVFYNAYGYKDSIGGVPVGLSTVFEACSLSKSFLAFVANQLVDENKLELDKPMYQYLPPGPALDYDPRYTLITPRMVLSHSSGLENWPTDNKQDSLEIIADPGKHFIYSGTGYNYLGAVIDKLLDEPYRKYVTDRVLVPYGLHNTYLYYDIEKNTPGDYALGHLASGETVTKWKNSGTIPASGNHVTAEDYAKLILATFSGKALSRNRINEIKKPVIDLTKSTDGSTSVYFGTGFELIYTKKDTIIAHGGSNTGFKAQMFYSPKYKRGLVLMANSDIGKAMVPELCKLSINLDLDGYFTTGKAEEAMPR